MSHGMGGGGNCPAGVTGNCGLHLDAPATPGRVTPDVEFFRESFMDGNQSINGVDVPVWGFRDGTGGGMGGGGMGGGGMGGAFPSPTIRAGRARSFTRI